MLTVLALLAVASGLLTMVVSPATAELPEEHPLWPEGITDNPIQYKEEVVVAHTAHPEAPSHSNRVCKFVSEPLAARSKRGNLCCCAATPQCPVCRRFRSR